MAYLNFQINSILGGQSQFVHETVPGQFLYSTGIDPEISVSTQPKGSGFIMPAGYAKFSDTVPSGAPMWIVTNPMNTKLYVYGTDGEFYSYSDVLASETSIGTPTSGAGNGAVYHNDFIYLFTPTNVSRYGKLSGTPSLTNTVWTGATLGSQSALANTTYPGSNNVTYPNHVAHEHTDGAVYFCDFASGQGVIHKIKTDSGGTDDGSAYNVLDLPFGYLPLALTSYGTDLAIIGTIMGSSTAIKQGQSYLLLWDTFADSFYAQIPIPGVFASAMVNVEGILNIWSGSVDRGVQRYMYGGGYSMNLASDSHMGDPPYAGAVDAYGDRAFWGTNVTRPTNLAVIMAQGYQNTESPDLSAAPLHNIGVADTGGQSLPTISALKIIQQNRDTKTPVIGWRTTTSATYGLSRFVSTATKNCTFRSEIFHVGRPFQVREIRTPLTRVVASGLTIVPKIHYDEATANKTLDTINNTNYSGLGVIKHKALEIEQATTPSIIGKNDFFLEWTFSGVADTGLALPIDILVETLDD